ncbi:hypothetical protein VTI74DRAFT_10732 [Chaetomium olivicolor]
MFASNIHRVIQELRRRRLGNSFEALLDLGEEMHDATDEPDVGVDLDQVDRLFSAIIQHSAYGIYKRVDAVINTILLLAIQRCEALQGTGKKMVPGRIGWLSLTHSETNQHLEAYRDFVTYIVNHPTARLSQDPRLEAARRLLQRLCPRINGLSRWTTTGVNGAEQKERRPTRRTRQSENKKLATQSPHKHQRLARPQLPTPPTQTGDVQHVETIPTLPRKGPLGQHAALLTPDTCPFSANVTESRIGGGWDEGPAVPIPVMAGVGRTAAGRDWAQRSMNGALDADGHRVNVEAGFRLRPQPAWSSRCCAFSVARTWE